MLNYKQSYVFIFIFGLIMYVSAQKSCLADDFINLAVGYEDKLKAHDQGLGAQKKGEKKKHRYRHVYEQATNQSLSHLYFNIGLYNEEDDQAIDHFMRVNHCDLYKAFSTSDIDWKEIRQSTKKYIAENKQDFPTRFEFPILLQLSDYDKETKSFNINEKFAINSSKRFESYSNNYTDKTCYESTRLFEGMPRIVHLEFSRPFTLLKVPMDEEKAYLFVQERLREARKEREELREATVNKHKDVYLFLNAKIFTSGKTSKVGEYGVVEVMGVLEGYSIYEDVNKNKLLYEHVFMTNKNKTVKDEEMAKQYEILREKYNAEGMLH